MEADIGGVAGRGSFQVDLDDPSARIASAADQPRGGIDDGTCADHQEDFATSYGTLRLMPRLFGERFLKPDDVRA